MNQSNIKGLGRMNQLVVVLNQHSNIPAHLKNEAWKEVSDGGLKGPLLNLRNQHAGKIHLEPT